VDVQTLRRPTDWPGYWVYKLEIKGKAMARACVTARSICKMWFRYRSRKDLAEFFITTDKCAHVKLETIESHDRLCARRSGHGW
jgi:hypothetical protein